jgi:hypothetical protein
MNNYLKKYLEITEYTDPKNLDYLYDDLPYKVDDICKIVNQQFKHLYSINKSDIEKEFYRIKTERGKVYNILNELLKIKNISLATNRGEEDRLIVTCREYSILLTSILREKGIPARSRAGFVTYIEGNYFTDHWINEYWDTRKNTWILKDSDRMKLNFKENEYFFAADVFLSALESKIDISKYGSQSGFGIIPIIMQLFSDLYNLFWGEVWYNPDSPITNKINWGEPISLNAATGRFTEYEKQLLIHVARLMVNADKNQYKITKLIQENKTLMPKVTETS